MHDQFERFRPSVVLIEDKASGTQLIQELIRKGLYAVTRYQPQSDKVMRSRRRSRSPGQARGPQSARACSWRSKASPDAAGVAFGNGRHDDQVDTTAQLLDWFKEGSSPRSNAGIFGLYRQRAEALRRGQTPGAAVRLCVPAGISHVQLLSGLRRAVAPTAWSK